MAEYESNYLWKNINDLIPNFHLNILIIVFLL